MSAVVIALPIGPIDLRAKQHNRLIKGITALHRHTGDRGYCTGNWMSERGRDWLEIEFGPRDRRYVPGSSLITILPPSETGGAA